MPIDISGFRRRLGFALLFWRPGLPRWPWIRLVLGG